MWALRPSPDRFTDILYGDKSVPRLAPDDPRAPLPLGRHFRNAGVIIARDRWDEETTLLQFRSASFYSENHHHRDENSFTLHYRSRLAIDSGIYDEGGKRGRMCHVGEKVVWTADGKKEDIPAQKKANKEAFGHEGEADIDKL